DRRLRLRALRTSAAAAARAPGREVESRRSAGGAPGHGDLVAPLDLPGDQDAVPARGLTEPRDPPCLRPGLVLGRRALRQRGRFEGAHDQDLLVVGCDRRSPRKPAVREPSGKPTRDLVELRLFHAYNITQ